MGSHKLDEMKRVLILGRAASGKSCLARTLGELTGLPVIELDKVFWQPQLQALPPDKWASVQNRLIQNPCWIMDGDLGPYDSVEIRLRAADTIIFLDFSILRCAWRASRRSHERADFWLWLLRYRHRSRPFLMKAIANHAPGATLHVLRNPKALKRLVADVACINRPMCAHFQLSRSTSAAILARRLIKRFNFRRALGSAVERRCISRA